MVIMVEPCNRKEDRMGADWCRWGIQIEFNEFHFKTRSLEYLRIIQEDLLTGNLEIESTQKFYN